MIHISLSFIIKEELKLPKLLVTWQVLGRDSIVYPSGICRQILSVSKSISCFISVLFRFDRILDIDHGNDFFGFVDLYIVYISLYQIDAGT